MILITLRWKHYEDKTPSQGYWSNCHCIVTSSLAPCIELKIVFSNRRHSRHWVYRRCRDVCHKLRTAIVTMASADHPGPGSCQEDGDTHQQRRSSLTRHQCKIFSMHDRLIVFHHREFHNVTRYFQCSCFQLDPLANHQCNTVA